MAQKTLELSDIEKRNIENWLKKIKDHYKIDSDSLAAGIDKYLSDVDGRDCQGSCGANCVSSCNYSCNNSCKNSCHGTCSDTCHGTCSGTLGF